MNYNSLGLVELLQMSAVEHLTTYRQLEVRDFGPVAMIVTTDFEALCAHECSDYHRIRITHSIIIISNYTKMQHIKIKYKSTHKTHIYTHRATRTHTQTI